MILGEEKAAERSEATRLSGELALLGDVPLRGQILLTLTQVVALEDSDNLRETMLETFRRILKSTPPGAWLRIMGPRFGDACFQGLVSGGVGGDSRVRSTILRLFSLLLEHGVQPSTSRLKPLIEMTLRSLASQDYQEGESAAAVLSTLLSGQAIALPKDLLLEVVTTVFSAEAEHHPKLRSSVRYVRSLEVLLRAYHLCLDGLEDECVEIASYFDGSADMTDEGADDSQMQLLQQRLWILSRLMARMGVLEPKQDSSSSSSSSSNSSSSSSSSSSSNNAGDCSAGASGQPHQATTVLVAAASGKYGLRLQYTGLRCLLFLYRSSSCTLSLATGPRQLVSPMEVWRWLETLYAQSVSADQLTLQRRSLTACWLLLQNALRFDRLRASYAALPLGEAATAPASSAEGGDGEVLGESLTSFISMPARRRDDAAAVLNGRSSNRSETRGEVPSVEDFQRLVWSQPSPCHKVAAASVLAALEAAQALSSTAASVAATTAAVTAATTTAATTTATTTAATVKAAKAALLKGAAEFWSSDPGGRGARLTAFLRRRARRISQEWVKASLPSRAAPPRRWLLQLPRSKSSSSRRRRTTTRTRDSDGGHLKNRKRHKIVLL